MGAFAHSGWGRTLGEIIAFFLFAGSRPQRNPIVSSPTRRPQLGAPRTDSFPNMLAGSESCPGSSPFHRAGGPAPPASSHWVRPVQTAPSSEASARFWPRLGPRPHSSLWLLAHPAGDFQKGLPDLGFGLGHFGCQVWSGGRLCLFPLFSFTLPRVVSSQLR